MLGGRGTVRKSLKMEDDGGGEELQGEAAGAGEIYGVQEVLEKGSLDAHRQTQNVVEKGGLGQEGDKEGKSNNLRTFMMALSEKSGPTAFSV